MDDRRTDGDTANRARRATTDGGTDGTDEIAETPVDAAVVNRVADGTGVYRERIADGLVVLNASLLGDHSTYEREYEYATVDGVRVYVVDRAAWKRLSEEHEFDTTTAGALERAHTRQAERLLERAVESLEIDTDQAGIVIGIDTAEDMR